MISVNPCAMYLGPSTPVFPPSNTNYRVFPHICICTNNGSIWIIIIVMITNNYILFTISTPSLESARSSYSNVAT
jgi:hypothetical protein